MNVGEDRIRSRCLAPGIPHLTALQRVAYEDTLEIFRLYTSLDQVDHLQTLIQDAASDHVNTNSLQDGLLHCSRSGAKKKVPGQYNQYKYPALTRNSIEFDRIS